MNSGKFGTLISALLCVVLVGCTASTQMADELMASQYVGRTTDEFFLRYGPPHEQFSLDSGNTIFLWSENATVYGSGVLSRQHVASNAIVVPTQGNIVVQCEVRIVADPTGVIRQILAQNDTIGKWQLSRCHELFSE